MRKEEKGGVAGDFNSIWCESERKGVALHSQNRGLAGVDFVS